MQTYRMIVRTETRGPKGGTKVTREIIENIIEEELPRYRHAADITTPFGATRNIKVVQTV